MLSGANGGSLLDFAYGVLEQQRGNEKAAGFFQRAYEDDPTSMPLVRIITNGMIAEGNRAGALEVFQKVIAARPEDFDIRLEYGDFLGRVGRGDAVADKLREETYRNVLAARPGSYNATERVIRILREKSGDDEARKLLEDLETDTPEAILYYVSSTKSLYDSRDEEAGKRIDARFGQAMEAHPEWEDIARKASDHFRETGRLDQAIQVLQLHVEALPSSLDLRIRQGILMFSAKRGEEGLRILQEVLAIHPGKALAHESLAKYYRKQGKPKEARIHAGELFKIRGGSPDDFIELAAEMIADGEDRAARLLLEKAAFYHPEDASLRMKLALATARDPETKDKAPALFKEAEEMVADGNEMDAAFLIESAKELVARGEVKAAEERLRTAIRSFPPEQ